MSMFAGLDVGGKRTAMGGGDEAGKIAWRGLGDTHPQMLAAALKRFEGKLAKVGLESGPWPKCARVAGARKLAVLLGRLGKDGAHCDAVVAGETKTGLAMKRRS